MNRFRRIWQRLSQREKGLVLATLAIFGLLLGRYFIWAPFVDRRESVKNQLELQPQRLEKNLRYIDRKPEIMAGLEKARTELKSLEPMLLTGDTPSVSASTLQETVQGFASKGGAQVISTRVLGPEAMGTFTRIPIQLEVTGQIDQLANLIQGIESSQPKLLLINEINVRSFAVVGAPPRRPDGAAQPPQNLRVSLIVSGFIRNQSAAPSKDAALDRGVRAKEKEDDVRAPRRRSEED
ncbi:MAG TPA: type II secretion system protein GspM [Candidatus Binatia bacterium]|jgi:Tfp pilus assembly protein PilO